MSLTSLRKKNLLERLLERKRRMEKIKNFEVINKPKLDPCHKKLLKKYTVNNMKKLRLLLFELFMLEGKEYDQNVHFDLDYINSAYREILYLWKIDKDPLMFQS
ncbi:hypothetical protein C1645_811013 [Glomus cerebriforme]|uniref:Uncharacterized protein n=1 Tax=Glomus cerebriforme TaxID=658196 RepID=A0A397TSQ1_9GLOM|nr:hypothetical protein C1645_811013 [Glomus cerebriforme]